MEDDTPIRLIFKKVTEFVKEVSAESGIPINELNHYALTGELQQKHKQFIYQMIKNDKNNNIIMFNKIMVMASIAEMSKIKFNSLLAYLELLNNPE